jgi:hypothetical protein
VERAKFAVNFECFIIQAQQVFLTMWFISSAISISDFTRANLFPLFNLILSSDRD